MTTAKQPGDPSPVGTSIRDFKPYNEAILAVFPAVTIRLSKEAFAGS